MLLQSCPTLGLPWQLTALHSFISKPVFMGCLAWGVHTSWARWAILQRREPQPLLTAAGGATHARDLKNLILSDLYMEETAEDERDISFLSSPPLSHN